VQTLERATALLKNAGTREGVANLARQLGFDGPLLSLDSAAKDALGFPAGLRTAHIARGVGSIRALALDVQDDADLRDNLTAVANVLARHSPQLLWMIIEHAV
jgi:hypothetical protein